MEDWKNVIWSDESKFNLLTSDGKEYYWTNRPAELTEEGISPTLKFGGRVCCIGMAKLRKSIV